MVIRLEQIRAHVSIGSFSCSIPDIKSFNVSRSRGQACSTCSVTFEAPVGIEIEPDSMLILTAGVKGRERTIFTGYVRSVQAQPSFSDARKYTISVNASDPLVKLEGKRYTRRMRLSGLEAWARITGGRSYGTRQFANDGGGTASRPGNRVGAFTTSLWNEGEHSEFIKAPEIRMRECIASEKSTEKANIYRLSPPTASVMVGQVVEFRVDNPALSASWYSPDNDVLTITPGGGDEASRKARVVLKDWRSYAEVYYVDDSGYFGKAAIVCVPPHDHTDVAKGGPAFGTYGTLIKEESE